MCVLHVHICGDEIAYVLRHYATRRKVAGSKPDDVNEILHFT
jgi:hypothetical protein